MNNLSNPNLNIEHVLPLVQRPGRYLGTEINSIHKDPQAVRLRVALLFPDLYEIGKSHLGLELLYQILNREEDIWAERAYTPALDLEAELRRQGLPLTSLESGTPLREFDLVGVSLQYELGYTNLLTMLELGGIPWLASERQAQDPVIIAGGPACFNPEPVAPFFDAMVIGEGEEVILELAAVVQIWKESGGSRPELWQALDGLAGVYVPACFEIAYDSTGHVQEIIPRGRQQRIRKRLIPDLNQLPLFSNPVVPHIQIIHDRLNVEIARGCTRGCRFCQAGMIYRPVRERSPESILAWIETALTATGFEEVSLLSLSSGDYGCLTPLLTSLMDRLESRRIAVSLPSLRADTLNSELMNQVKRVRKTGFTIAPEAGSERLRQIINKNLTDAEIVQTVRDAFALGWNLIKLYFMIGFPMETREDLEAIGAISRKVLATGKGSRRGARLHVSLNTFIPKPHTPFQWERQLSLPESRERLHLAKDLVQHKGIELKWNPADQGWLEGIFSRGDRRLAEVVMAAQRRGCRFDAWTEHFRLDRWRQAFEECHIDPDSYLRSRSLTETLPWDHIDSGVRKDFLITERNYALQEVQTPDCRRQICQDCGVCDMVDIQPVIFSPSTPLTEKLTPGEEGKVRDKICSRGDHPISLNSNGTSSYRMQFAKLDGARWFSHLELISILHRAIRRSGLPISFSQGFHPMPRLSFHNALPLGVESLGETMDIEMDTKVSPVNLVSRLNESLPSGLKILGADYMPKKLPPPKYCGHLYAVQSPEATFTAEVIEEFRGRPECLVTRQKPKEVRHIDLHPLLEEVRLQDGHNLELTLKQREKDNLKASEAVAAIFSLDDEQTKQLKIIKIKSYTQETVSPEPGTVKSNQ